jgi:hypothetical protein
LAKIFQNVWLSNRSGGFLKTTHFRIDAPDELTEGEITLVDAANVGLGNWR